MVVSVWGSSHSKSVYLVSDSYTYISATRKAWGGAILLQ